MLVVVGGNSRKSGKTSYVEKLIREAPERHWTVIKITTHPHKSHPGSGDTGRYREAGATNVRLIEAPELEMAIPEDSPDPFRHRERNHRIQSHPGFSEARSMRVCTRFRGDGHERILPPALGKDRCRGAQKRHRRRTTLARNHQGVAQLQSPSSRVGMPIRCAISPLQQSRSNRIADNHFLAAIPFNPGLRFIRNHRELHRCRSRKMRLRADKLAASAYAQHPGNSACASARCRLALR